MKGRMRYPKAAWLLGGLLVTLPQVATGASTTTITVKVMVLAPPPCTINDNKAITVEFGDVITTRVDGSNYRMPVNYSLLCTGSSTNAMTLQVQGNGATFDGEVLKTNQVGLGIALQQGGLPVGINRPLNFTYPTKPDLWAVPVKQSGVTLTGGEFTASATMKVNYQ